jgi:hypothetical protein
VGFGQSQHPRQGSFFVDCTDKQVKRKNEHVVSTFCTFWLDVQACGDGLQGEKKTRNEESCKEKHKTKTHT